ncbi:antirestriction protein [Ramlibacter albus]|uniref:antirestriction protein n=1 Tax=Ramlibacter albus TaxID=2079448 RepID=UPI001C9A3D06
MIPDHLRASHFAKLFGVRTIHVESYVFDTASSLSPDYNGGHWTFHGLCNGGFYMAPTIPDRFRVECANGFDGVLSADAFGITCSLYAYSLLSFSPDHEFAQACTEHFHKLREFMLDHEEAASIQRAID